MPLPTTRACCRRPPLATLPEGLRDATPLVGRDAELQALRDAWQRTLAGAPATVVLRGPAGAGATRLAAALAQEVARDGGAVATSDDGAHEEPWLLVVDRSAPRPDGAMLLHLAGPGSTDSDTATVIELAPLSEPEVRRVVGGYVAARDTDAVTADVLASGPAWPGRVHDVAARLARQAATERLTSAVGVAGEASVRLSDARAEVNESIVVLSDEKTLDATGAPGSCPWRGLASYEIEDAPWFAGREHLVAELLARLAPAGCSPSSGPRAAASRRPCGRACSPPWGATSCRAARPGVRSSCVPGGTRCASSPGPRWAAGTATSGTSSPG